MGVCEDDLEEYIGRPGWSSETRKSARTALRSFYRWAHRKGLIGADPSSDLPSVAVPFGVPRPTPEDIVHELVLVPGRIGTMAMLAAYCGLRRGEIARVHRDDLAGKLLLVHGKGGKERIVPVVSAELLARIQAADGWLFPNGFGSHLSPGWTRTNNPSVTSICWPRPRRKGRLDRHAIHG